MTSEMVKKISAESGLSEEEIQQKVQEKQEELSGLISEDGAVYIVAKELGIQVMRKKERLYISSIVPGMKSVDIVGKVMRIFPVKEFSSEKGTGKVANIVLGDNTGTVRMSLWNDELEALSEMNVGDVIRVKGFSREGYDGNAELRIGRYGLMQKSTEKIDAVQEQSHSVERTSIKDLREGYAREVRACIVQMFESNIFYPVCSQCKARLREESGFKCEEHGEVEPDHGIVLSCIIDDGTGSIRAVMFNEQAEAILGMSKKEAKRLYDMKRDMKNVYANVQIGMDYVFRGKARRNALFDRLEFVVSSVRSVDVKEEVERLLVNG
ncbi:MAG: DUF2240 family protein [Candidatus Aenigmarchaeota archaeon]|nr:DUF2240 family protein [Candidatus Aenigmarchaeota archaeon]